MRKKKKPSVWFSKSVFYAMGFLTFASVVTSCTVIQSKPIKVKTIYKEPVVVDIQDASEKILLACEENDNLLVCKRLN